MFRRLMFFPLLLSAAVPVDAQTVLFDGIVQEDRQAAALLVPAVVTGDDYSAFGRFEYGFADRIHIFGQMGGRFNGGATAMPGVGWSATFYRQTDDFPVNIGFFNSFIFPVRTGGPDAFITVAPVFSHSWERSSGAALTPYAGLTSTFNVNRPGRGGRTDVNGLLGVKVSEIAAHWDFVAEVQPGEKSLFALGFAYRF
jgi:hypothetical protein